MKVACDREKLFNAFQTAASVAPSRSPKPILQNVKLEVSGQGAETAAVLSATDLEVGIRVAVSGIEAEADGGMILPVGRFGLILRESTDVTIRLDTDGTGITVRGERSEFRLPAENPAEFPAVASFNETKYHELPARAFRELIRRTVFATDNESTRYALGGVLLEMSADKIVGVGTDGRRLAMMQVPAKSVGDHKTGDNMTIVPTRAMQLMERALADSAADVQISARPNDILVRTDRTTIYSRLHEGRFPRWRDVFPHRDNTQKIPLVVGTFHSAVRQAAIVTSEESRGVDFTFEDGKVSLAGRAMDSGQSRIDLPIAYDGASLAITLDPRYVNDFLRVLDGETTFTIELKDSDSAAVCSTDDGYSYVIMPLARDR